MRIRQSCQPLGSLSIGGLISQAACSEDFSSGQAHRACPALREFFEAFASAFSLCPQALQTNASCVFRFSGETWPQTEQVWRVYCGGTLTTRSPEATSLYVSRVWNVPHPGAHFLSRGRGRSGRSRRSGTGWGASSEGRCRGSAPGRGSRRCSPSVPRSPPVPEGRSVPRRFPDPGP